jgi:hypothetical protein
MLVRPHKKQRKPKPPRRMSMKRTVRTLLSPQQLDHAMLRESTRVDRKNATSLTMVLFRLPDYKDQRSAVRLARTILKRIRVTDDLGWFDREHLGLLLPETPAAGAWRLAQDVCDIIAQRSARPLCTMYTYPVEATDEPSGVIRTSEAQQALSVKVAS